MVTFFKDKGKTDGIMEYISQNHNTIILGYSEERAKFFKKNSNEFINQWKNKKDNSVEI